jgi:hypothetical protein
MYRDGSTISLLPYPQTQVCEMYILQVAVVMKKYRILEKSVLCVPGSEFSTLYPYIVTGILLDLWFSKHQRYRNFTIF